jgi:hypothetical protein
MEKLWQTFCLPFTVISVAIPHTHWLLITKSKLLEAGVAMYSDNQHARLLFPSLRSSINQVYSGLVADSVMQSSEFPVLLETAGPLRFGHSRISGDNRKLGSRA